MFRNFRLCFLLMTTGIKVLAGVDTIEAIPANVTTAEGQTAILPCSVPNYSNEMVIWMNPKRIVISKEESKFMNDIRMSIENPFIGDYNLHIREVKYEDRGDYTCNINTHPVTVKRVRLTVNVPSKIVEFSNKKVREKHALEGTDVELTCNATGVPTPTVTWFRQIEGDRKERVGSEGETLVIHNISRYCDGLYECMAFNNVPPAVTNQIEVKVEFKPEVTVLTPRIGQKVDKETMLQCTITASPIVSSSWLYNNRDIRDQESRKYQVEVYQEDRYTVALTLRIKSVRPDDFGIYTCMAKNKHGEIKAQMELYEYIEPTPSTTTTTTTSKPLWNPNDPRTNGEGSYRNNDDVTKGTHDHKGRKSYIHKMSSDTQLLGTYGTGQLSFGNSSWCLKSRNFLIIKIITLIIIYHFCIARTSS